jgi:hypothetical protein
MGIKTLLYTHTDYSDVWKPFLSRFRKYFSDAEIYFCVNTTEQELPANTIPIYYDDSKTYTERLSQCIEQIGNTTVLFIHEDMILYDEPIYSKLEDYVRYVEENKAHSIKLIPVGTIIGRPELDETLVHTTYSRFSIQPTIIRTDSILGLIEEVGKVSIWEFEALIKQKDTDYVAYTGTESKRGMHHFDSKVFPYTATAIVKGKWNFSEYPNELTEILLECGIDKEVRGVV